MVIEGLGDLGETRAVFNGQGCRQLIWRVDEPGSLFNNKFERAVFQIVEREPWEPGELGVTAERRVDRFSWTRFTDTAAERIAAAFHSMFPSARFVEEWMGFYRETLEPSGGLVAEVEAAWWWAQRQAELVAGFKSGAIIAAPIDRGVQYLAERPRVSKEHVSGRALSAALTEGGVLVGFVSRDGEMIPR